MIIFSGIDSPKPWTANKGLGAVVVVCGGRLQEDDYYVLCTISASGGLHLFDALKEVREIKNGLFYMEFAKRPKKLTYKVPKIPKKCLQ